ncbi:hypothetical protein DFQ26_009567 [Actinomortierella ambigua]|nr:hypothetical protein DFQ26_009567 [Actinomortierella ambigua]
MTLLSPTSAVSTLGLQFAYTISYAVLNAPFERASLILRTLPEYERLERQRLQRQRHHHPKEKTGDHHSDDDDSYHISSSTVSSHLTIARKRRGDTFKTLKLLYCEDGVRGLWHGWTLGAVYYCTLKALQAGIDGALNGYFPAYPTAPSAESMVGYIGMGNPGYWSWFAAWTLLHVGVEGLKTFVLYPLTVLHLHYVTDRPGYGVLYSSSSSISSSSSPPYSTTTTTTRTTISNHSQDAGNLNSTSSTTLVWSMSTTRGGAYRYKDIRDLFQQSLSGSSPSSSPSSLPSSRTLAKKVRWLYRGWPLQLLSGAAITIFSQLIVDTMNYSFQRGGVTGYSAGVGGGGGKVFSAWQVGAVTGSAAVAAVLLTVGVYAVNTVQYRVVLRAAGKDDDDNDGEVEVKESGDEESYWQVAKSIVREEGSVALWSGFSAGVLAVVVPTTTIVGFSLLKLL